MVFDECSSNISNESICSDDLKRNLGDLIVSNKGKEMVSNEEGVSLN